MSGARCWEMVIDHLAIMGGAPGAIRVAPERGQPLVRGVVVGDATCSVDGCEQAVRCRGWCSMHYRRWRRTGETGSPERQRGGTRTGLCSVEGCEGPVWSRGWCNTHYNRWHRLGDPLGKAVRPMAETRFWAKVDRRGPDECWLWMASVGGRSGYGRFRADGGKQQAHRFAYELLIGPVPDGLHLDHLCRTPRCVNPSHLEPVTNKENWSRGMAPSAIVSRRGVCLRGHPRSENATFTGGAWHCRACRRINHADRRDRSA